jgi:hypothetical protein
MRLFMYELYMDKQPEIYLWVLPTYLDAHVLFQRFGVK